MINGMRIKVCGLTALVDAEFADRCDVDFLGFVLHPESPRHVSLAQYRAMAARLPDRKKVAVVVEPAADELMMVREAGFDFFQVHFRHDLPAAIVAGWSKTVRPERLWLAPRLPPESDAPAELLPLAGTFLLDAYEPGRFGGTGRPGDRAKFRRHREKHPEKTWILSGGLNPDNIGAALVATGANFVDVNSGVETAPGVKDHAKLKSFIARLREATKGG